MCVVSHVYGGLGVAGMEVVDGMHVGQSEGVARDAVVVVGESPQTPKDKSLKNFTSELGELWGSDCVVPLFCFMLCLLTHGLFISSMIFHHAQCF